ncbi:MAG: L-histidine N(alpha)-methyltransferase [Bacteroidetes bacterium]|nr:L-histidine N(alpha)-methyltransferase [Bacteroidota bacterium]
MELELDKIQLELLDEIINGLSQKQKMLPSKLFYDEKGSKLFDLICELDEYYPTRTESMIMKNNIDDIVSVFKENTIFIEFGSGSSMKTRLLLDNLNNLSAYIPIDISEDHLFKTTERLIEEYPGLEIIPISADYTKPYILPEIHKKVKHKITYFPGSTIGNFKNDEAKAFLKLIAETCGREGGLLIGIDLHKDKDIIEAAYNDKENVTAEFNLNLLERLNREYGADFEISKFSHLAFYNEDEKRIEMHLISEVEQTVTINERKFYFKKSETILTEYSHKYTFSGFAELAEDYFEISKIWIDKNKYFSVLYLSVK